MAIIFTDENFENDVILSDIPVLVDFYADWCGPCKMMAPVLDSLSQEYQGRVKVGKINVDENQEIASNFNIMTIPTFMIFLNGKISKKFTGVIDRKLLKEALDQVL